MTLASSMHLMQCTLSAYERGSWRQRELYGIVWWHRSPQKILKILKILKAKVEAEKYLVPTMVLYDALHTTEHLITYLRLVLVQLMPLRRKAKATGGSEVSSSVNGWVDFRKSMRYHPSQLFRVNTLVIAVLCNHAHLSCAPQWWFLFLGDTHLLQMTWSHPCGGFIIVRSRSRMSCHA